MLSQALQDSLNEQIKNEFYSAHVYLAMSSWFEDKGLPGICEMDAGAVFGRIDARSENL